MTRRRLLACSGTWCTVLLTGACGESPGQNAPQPPEPTATKPRAEQRGPAIAKGITAEEALRARQATPIPPTSTTAGPSPSTAATQITFWAGARMTATAERLLKARTTQFNATHDALTVVIQPGAQRGDRIKAAISAGSPPSVAAIASWDAANLATTAAPLDLETAIKRDQQWNGWYGDLLPELLHAYTWQGKLTAVPWWVTALGMLANPDHLSEVGLSSPKPDWTWQDCLEIGRRVTRPPDRYALGQRWTWEWYEAWLLTNGLTVFNKDTTKVNFAAPAALETMAFIQGLIKEGLAPPRDLRALFRRRRATFDHAGLGDVALYRQRWRKEHPVGVLQMPRQQGTLVRGESQALLGFRTGSTKQDEGALTFVKWLTSPEQTISFAVTDGTVFPPYKSARTAAETVAYGQKDREWRFYYDLAPVAVPSQTVPSLRAIHNLMTKWMQQLLGKKVGLAEGITQGQQEMQRLLDRDHQAS